MVRHPDINRRGDIAALRWDQRCSKTVFLDGEAKSVDGFELRQGKTGKRLFLPITPILSEVLEGHPATGRNRSGDGVWRAIFAQVVDWKNGRLDRVCETAERLHAAWIKKDTRQDTC